ncbi:phosphatidylinositol N-acetylglucosaminyltransferase subunit C [Vespula maculifrons]|uniref:Phosphatidylinositol N-acetylglucosaminyltransferase subunit C n=1 Tax=Vespula maculifrons TaxID=7453 RepID=A0ABD2BWH6_VESMC
MYTSVKWKKNLYEFTDLPDNYTDSTFLTELRKNVKSDYVSRLEAINLAAILRTLTETISTDTIYAMTILMFLTHLIFNKYGSTEIFFSDSLSITSSIFGSLMLASRLASPLHAFSLLTVSLWYSFISFVHFGILDVNNLKITSMVLGMKQSFPNYSNNINCIRYFYTFNERYFCNCMTEFSWIQQVTIQQYDH